MNHPSLTPFKKKLGRFLLATSLLAGMLPGNPVRAQEILWNAPAAIAGDTDVVTLGTPVYAYDYANASETVNGVAFAGANSVNAGGNVGTTLTTFNTTAYTSTANPFAALSPSYQGMLVGAAYALTSSGYTVTLSNLVSGHAYLVQFWVNDPRGTGNGRAVALASLGGNSVVLENSTGPGTTGGYPGQYCVGLFTNYGSPQTFTLQTAGTALDAGMTALQVRDLGQALALNAGDWNGLAGNVLNYSSLDFCTNAFNAPLGTAASLATVAGLNLPIFLGDAYFNNSSAIAVTANNLTVATGGITNGQVNFINTNVNYTLNSSDANGITGTTTVGEYGAGLVTFAGPNTYTGGTVIAGGTLQIGAGGASGSLGSGPVANYGALVFDRSDNPVFTNVISGVGTVTQAGSGTLTLSNAIMSGPLTTLSQVGSGALVLTGTNTYGGNLIIGQGTVNINGSGPGGNPYGSLYVGGNTGTATVNFNTTGTWSIGTSVSGIFYVGGTGSSSDTSAGAFNMSAGTINFSDGNYFTLGSGGSTCYGSFTQSGGTFTVVASEGVRIGEGGMGSWVQTGGSFTSQRYFVVGGNGGTGSANIGVATFLGGTTTLPSGYFLILGNLSGSYGMMNVGTEAGGNALFTAPDTTGPEIGQVSGATGVLNLNSGILAINGPIITASGGTGTVNLNGGTIQAGASNPLINSTVTSVTVYNGGLTVNDQSYNNLISAALLGATGNGIYPAGGILTIGSGGGSGYIGAPLVTVSGGSGAGALAIASISGGVVTNVILTCPGQNYLVGDTLSFAFAGGGATTPANTFSYTLKAGDLAPNATGGLTKVGSGTLTLSGANTYTGSTIVGAGTLVVSNTSGSGLGNVVVANGAALTLTNGATTGYLSSTANLAFNATATINLGYSGNMTINGLSTNGGLNFVVPGIYGAVGSGATYQLPQLAGTGLITVTATPVVIGDQVQVTSSPNPCVVGQTVTFTGTVTGSGATPSGSVTFLNGGVSIGSAALNAAGMAVLTNSFTNAGSFSITASYSGNGTYSSATSLVPVSQLVKPRLDLWTGAKSGVWDITTTSNWLNLASAAVYHDGDAVQLDDTATGGTALSLGAIVKPNYVLATNNVKNYSLSGAGSISGPGSLTLVGAGTLTVSTTNSYAGNTVVSNGVLTFSGAGSSIGGGVLSVGDGNGVGVLNLSGTGTLTFGGTPSLGGISGDTNDFGSGAINQSSGTINLATDSSDVYMELGTGGTNGYGSYNQSGGTLNIINASGVRIGQGGFGSWVQTGGTMNCSRYFVVGGNSGNVASTNDGVATFLGGAANLSSSYYLIIGNLNPSFGVMNLGTEAGGNATFTAPDGTGPQVAQVSGSTGTLNLNSGILNVAGAIATGSGGNGTVNLNGGTIQAGGNSTLINFTPAVFVYNGGVVFDTLAYTATSSANLQAASGNGIYPAGGVLTIPSGGGTNYIGAPLVTVIGGSGSGAMAIANLSNSVVTGVTLTCPGQNYLAGDSLSFAFAGGGTATPANVFNYTLKPADVAANLSGGLTKIGSGVLVQSGNCGYTGPTVISNGTLQNDGSFGTATAAITVAGGMLDGAGYCYGPVTVQTGGTLGAGDPAAVGTLTLSDTLSLAGTASLRIDNTGGGMLSDNVSGVTTLTYGGTLSVTNITSDGTPLAVGNTFTLFTSSTYSGSFNHFSLPALPKGLAWNLSNLAVNGSIQVTNYPVITSFSVLGATLNLSATNGTPGAQYVLLGTTNLAAPLSQWIPILTNDYDVNGMLNLSTNVINSANHQEFYLLAP